MKLSLDQIYIILAAMRDVATAQGKQSLTDLQARSIKALYQYVFSHKDKLALNSLPSIKPEKFPSYFSSEVIAEYALRFLTIASLMDGEIDQEKIKTLFQYAEAVDIYPHYLLQLQKTLENDINWLIRDITLKNLESFDLFPNLQREEDIDKWLFPYREHPDPGLVARYERLQKLPQESFGYRIWKQFKDNNYFFPGEAEGANYAFIMPHDSLHVLSGYDTTPFGELLVSTFTSTMLEKKAMEGHIIPVFYSFYLGIKINNLAGVSKCKMNPEAFWEAWHRGSQMQINLFAHDWSLWEVAEIALSTLRQKYGVLPKTIE
ncbi:hypothetical protein [Legionella sp. 227]|uniref:hypothetical protein n=1 Tax=Legionella sp. 227 TaxID=3367288 RepID=UPI00370DB3FD